MDVVEVQTPLRPRKIICTQVPLELFDRNTAKIHFRQFGRVLRIIMRPRSHSLTIEYDCHENAEKAILSSGEYMGYSFDVKFSSPVKRKKKIKDVDSDWAPDPEIQEELEAMATMSEGCFKKQYNLRPEAMMVDTVTTPLAKAKKSAKRSWTGETPKRRKMKCKIDPEESSWTAEQLELLEILKTPVFTAEEKYKVLEARDKLIRLRTKKQTGLKGATKGMCPDMCPEKERLMREVQHQVAFYEQDSNAKGMNPRLAIKQYSRSSADQEVPLPHDLRPVAVLQLTMNYLMHRIMNLCDTPDVNLAEWYHFLWDRTRGIRKDITQQELCCEGSVTLLEQCARFHIHCSARLVGEDRSVFDQKINTENLTKCLQTLKYMYHDLYLKGIACANEAEFRAYIILLNLNDGNFMWEVQQLKPEIQKSKEVKFALQVYSAIDKNNFVKFFKLVQRTGYLNACILFRYFVQVRTKALATILKCYSPRAPYTHFPLALLTELLAFEEKAAAMDFVTSYGLHLNSEQTHVVLDRKNFEVPEIPCSLDRAINVIESKRSRSVGDVVNGGPLPPCQFEDYTVSNSFDENGLFIITGVVKDLIKDAESVTPEKTTTAEEESVKPFWSVKVEEKGETGKDEQSGLFSFVPKEQGIKPSGQTIKPAEQTTKPTFTFSQTQTPAKSFSFIKELEKPSTHQQPGFPTQNTPDQVKNSFESQSKNIFEQPSVFEPIKSAFSTWSQAPLPTQTVVASIFSAKPIQSPSTNFSSVFSKSNVTPLPAKSPEETVRQKERERLAELEKLKLLQKEEQLRKEIEEAKRKAELRKLQLEEEKRRMEKERLLSIERERRIEQERKEALLRENERKQKMHQEVTALISDLLTAVEEKLRTDRLREIRASIRQRKNRMFICKWRERLVTNKRKRQAMDQNPIWLPSRSVQQEARELFTDTQSATLQQIKRYKSGKSWEVALPSVEEIPKMDVAAVCASLAKSVTHQCHKFPKEMFWKLTVSLPDFREFKHGLHRVEEVLGDTFQWKDKYGNTSVTEQYVAESCLTYTIEKKQGVHVVENNSNGLLFIASEPNYLFADRMREALKSFSKCTAVPVAVIFIANETPTEDLIFPHDTEGITSYNIQACHFATAPLVKAIKDSLVYLAERIQPAPPLELNSFKAFLDMNLVNEPWKRISSYALWNCKYKECMKSPTLVIALYNESIERLKEILVEEANTEHSNFPDEFEKYLMDKHPLLPCDYRYFPSFWKASSYRELLLNTLQKLELPRYKSTWPPETAEQLEQDVLAFCEDAFKEPHKPFYKMMAVLLQNIDPLINFLAIKNILWTDVIEVVALEKIQEVDFSLHPTVFYSKSDFNEMFAVYNKETLDAHNQDEWFYLKHPLVQDHIKNQRPSKTKKAAPVDWNLRLDELEKSIREDEPISIKEKSADMQELLNSLEDLEESLEIQSKTCVLSQKRLKRALNMKC